MIQSFAFPTEWQPDVLSAVADIVPGKTPAKAEYRSSGDIKVIKFRDVSEAGGVDFTNDDEGWIDSTQCGRTEFAMLLPESILLTNAAHSLSHIGKKIGYLAELPHSTQTCFVGELTSMRAKSTDINTRWLFYLLQTEPLRREIAKSAEGAHLVPYWLKRVPLARPTVREQTRIAEALTAVDDYIRAVEAQIQKAERVKKSLLQAFPPSPKHGTGTPLHRVADITSGFTKGRDLGGHDTVEIPYLTVVNVLEGRVDISDISSADVKLHEVEHYGLREGDILMTEGGDRDKVGRGSIWLGQIPRVVCQNHIFRVRLNTDEVLPWFMHYLLQTYSAKRYFTTRAKQSSNLCSINSREMRLFELPTLTTRSQEPWVTRLRAADATIEAIESQRTVGLRIKQSLLQNLLTGKIRLKA